MSFQDQCRRVFIDNTAARLARWSGYGHRAAQKFLADKAEVPRDLAEAVELQHFLLNSNDPSVKLQAVVDEALASGLSKESVASRLSILHKALTGVDVS